jgi:TonB-linked SusC/RagA family outer membrane protein
MIKRHILSTNDITNVKKSNCLGIVKTLFLFTLFVFNICFSYANSSYAQTKTLSVDAKNQTIKEVLHQIENISEYIFVYDAGNKDLDKKISISTQKQTIYQILDEVFKNTNIIYKVSDRQVLIATKNEIKQPDQKKETTTIKGNVSDKNGDPLIGVSIILKDNKNIGSITDIDGNYSIAIPKDKFAVLQYNYIGFIPREEEVGNRQIINVIMEENVGQLDEVVVVGFGSQKKASVVGSISTIEPQQLKTSTTRALSNTLAGNISGVIAVQRSGEPGRDGSSFWIRGISTFADNSRNPLVLIDGIERSLDDISVDEIESFSVLKDASATAVYGVRGANGVILITTKRGRLGKPSINFSFEHSITEPVQLPKFLGAADYMQLMNDISNENGNNMLYAQERIDRTRSGYDPELYPDINWVDAISKDYGNNTRISADINGGSERIRYAFVMTYYHEGGILERDKQQEWDSSLRLNKYNVRSNIDINLTQSTKLWVSIGGYLQRRFSPQTYNNDRQFEADELFKRAFETPPFVHPPHYSTGQIPKIPERTNPWADLTQRGYERWTNSKIETLLSLEQDFSMLLPGLKSKVTFSFDNYSQNGVKRGKDPDYYNVATGRDPETGALDLIIASYGQDFLGHERKQSWGNNSTYLEANITYNQTFATNHTVEALLLYNQREYDDGDKLPYRNQGFAGRFGYTLMNRYIAEFNFGYNGSENFMKNRRFGFFPSVAIGWIMSEEPFMEKYSKTFTKVKFRGSWGQVGNDRLDGRRFAYLTTINGTDGYYWGNSSNQYHRDGKWEGDIGVPNLTWETVTKTNIGLELGLWNLLELQVDLFKEKRRDIFQKRNNFPNSAGFAELPWANFGKVDNKGIDMSLNINKEINKDLYISAKGTFTYAKNKVLEKDEDMGVIGTYRSTTGKPVGQIMGLVDKGLYTEDDFADVSTGKLKDGMPVPVFGAVRPGDIKYMDANNDGIIDDKDRCSIGGTVNPEIVYGFGVNIGYKGFDMGAFFQGNGRTYRTIGRGSYFLPGSTQGATGNIYANADDRWTPDNPSQDVFYPRLTIGNNPNNSQESTWWLRNMSMLRLKNLEIGYTFSKQLIRNAGLQNARVFLRGTNLVCFSEFDMWDPELDTPDNNGLQYPMMRTFSAGLQLNF